MEKLGTSTQIHIVAQTSAKQFLMALSYFFFPLLWVSLRNYFSKLLGKWKIKRLSGILQICHNVTSPLPGHVHFQRKVCSVIWPWISISKRHNTSQRPHSGDGTAHSQFLSLSQHWDETPQYEIKIIVFPVPLTFSWAFPCARVSRSACSLSCLYCGRIQLSHMWCWGAGNSKN